MSGRGDALAADILAAVYRHSGVVKSTGQAEVIEAVVRPLCSLIGRYEEHIAYVDMMLKAMNQPAGGPLLPNTIPYRTDEWRMTRTGERS